LFDVGLYIVIETLTYLSPFQLQNTNTIDPMPKQVVPLNTTERSVNADCLPLSGDKRILRMRSTQGQLRGGDKKRGKGGRHNNITHQEIVNLEQSGAPTFLISKFILYTHPYAHLIIDEAKYLNQFARLVRNTETYQMISTCNPDLAEWYVSILLTIPSSLLNNCLIYPQSHRM
jgi:hypothetical protein